MNSTTEPGSQVTTVEHFTEFKDGPLKTKDSVSSSLQGPPSVHKKSRNPYNIHMGYKGI